MFLTTPTWNYYNTTIYNVILQYRSQIFSVLNKAWKDEDLEGETCRHYITGQYFLAVLLIILILEKFKTTPGYTWTQAIEDFGIVNAKKQLACNNIDLDKLFSIFGIDTNGGCGIEHYIVEHTFIIESCGNNGTPAPVIDILALIAGGKSCTNYIDTCN